MVENLQERVTRQAVFEVSTLTCNISRTNYHKKMKDHLLDAPMQHLSNSYLIAISLFKMLLELYQI